MNAWFAPTTRDTLGVGVRVTVAGTGKFVVLTALLLLHPARKPTRTRRRPKIAEPTNSDLLIYPPRSHGRPQGEFLCLNSVRKAPSVEAAIPFGKFEPVCGRPSPQAKSRTEQ